MEPAEVVPPELLVPPDAHSRGFCPHDAALVLDGYLRRLASQESRCRAVLGQLALAFRKRQGHGALGFARLDDYARERLGFSGRELQSLTSVTARLATLPETAAAFERGELSWAQVRLVVTVAMPETDGEWVALARGRTVRALAALIREAGREVTEEDDTDGEPPVRFRLRCPRRLVPLWRRVVELARRMAGAELTQGQAAEAIAAEGLSAGAPSVETWPEPWRSAEAPSDPAETRATFADLDWTAVREAIPEEVEHLGLGIDDLDAFVLDDRMRAVVRAMHRIDWQLGRLLRLFLDRRLYRLMLFPSAARYLRERLGLSPRKARALVAVERKTWQAPAFGEAYRAGELSWARALAVLPILTEKTAGDWVARAREVTVRRLMDEVEWALTVSEPCAWVGPPPLGASIAEPERQMCARRDWEWPDAEIAFSGAASVVALFRAAILAFTRPGDTLWADSRSYSCT